MFELSGDTKQDLFNLQQDYLRLKNYVFKYAKPYEVDIEASKGEKGQKVVAVELKAFSNDQRKLTEQYQELQKALQGKSGSAKLKAYEQYKIIRNAMIDEAKMKSVGDDEFKSVLSVVSSKELPLAVNKMKSVVQISALHEYYYGVYQSLDETQKSALASHMLNQSLNSESMLGNSQRLAEDVKKFSLSREEILSQMYGDHDAVRKAVVSELDLKLELSTAKEKLAELNEKRESVYSEIKDIKKLLQEAENSNNVSLVAELSAKLSVLDKQNNLMGKEAYVANGRVDIIEKLLSKKKDSVPITEVIALLSDDKFNKLVSEMRAKQLLELKHELNANPTVDASNRAFNLVMSSSYLMSNSLSRFSDDPNLTYKSVNTIQRELCAELMKELTSVVQDVRANKSVVGFDADQKARLTVALSHMVAHKSSSVEEITLLARMALVKHLVDKDPQMKALYSEAAKNTEARVSATAEVRAQNGATAESKRTRFVRGVSKLFNRSEVKPTDAKSTAADTPTGEVTEHHSRPTHK